MTPRLSLSPLLAVACLFGCYHPEPSSDAHQLPLVTRSRPATVLLFIAPECPISNGYAPELRRISEKYSPRGAAFFAVHSDPTVTRDAAAKHAAEYNLPFPVLLDPEQKLTRQVGATVTPEAAVLDPTGTVRYLGRIDDLYYSFGRRRTMPTSRELVDALDAVLAGRPVSKAFAAPIGCEIAPPARK
jgi:thiol-disulfide isomerase/thioredoxin